MNKLHRELAPISKAAWGAIEEEAARSFRSYAAARRAVDVVDARGAAAISTRRLDALGTQPEGVLARRRAALPVIEWRVPFALERSTIEALERGAADADLQPVKDAARRLAAVESRIVFAGSQEAGIAGIASAGDPLPMPAQPEGWPQAFATARERLRRAAVSGPYIAVLGAPVLLAMQTTILGGYPVLEIVRKLLGEGARIVWADTLEGAYILSARGGDFAMHLASDAAIGYAGCDERSVQLYLEEAFSFQLIDGDAAISFQPGGRDKKQSPRRRASGGQRKRA